MSRSPINTSKIGGLGKSPMSLGGKKATNKKAISGVAKLTDTSKTENADGQVDAEDSDSDESSGDYVTDDSASSEKTTAKPKDPKKAAHEAMKALYGAHYDYKTAQYKADIGLQKDELATQRAIAEIQAKSQNSGIGAGIASQIPSMVGALASGLKGSGGGSGGGGSAQGTKATEEDKDKMHEMHEASKLAKADDKANTTITDKFGNKIEVNPSQGQVSIDHNGMQVAHQATGHANTMDAYDYDSANGMSLDAHGTEMHSVLETANAVERSDNDSEMFAQVEDSFEPEEAEMPEQDFEVEEDYA